MIVRLRARAGLYMSLGLLVGGWTLAATATQTVTRSEMEAFVYAALAIAGFAVLGGMAGVLAFILNRDRESARESREQIIEVIGKLTAGLDRAVVALESHNLSEFAHPVAARSYLAPVNARLNEMDAKLDRIEADCEAFCRRDPSASPHRRRQSDPDGEDHAGERGRE